MGRQVLTTRPWIALVALVAFVALVGCRSEINPAYCVGHADPRCPDGGGSNVPDVQSPLCFGAGAWKVCVDALPANTLQLGSTLDTSEGSPACAAAQPVGWIEAGQPAACFVIAKVITLSGAKLAATGPRPLVVLASELLDIDDEFSLSAKNDQPQTIPAGFDPAGCPAFPLPPPGNDNGGAGGGAGGSFSTKGGNGGAGINTAVGGLAAEPVGVPTLLHGGCIGQLGGVGDMPPATNGGNGGGAVYFVSRAITLGTKAAILVSGAGGGAGGHHYGGGGAGSGGMIVLYADAFAINSGAVMIANGGGGASGGAGGAGERGNDPSTSNPTSVATGGTASGGDGGNGYAGGAAATPGLTMANTGGGGGGGGAGFILTNQPIQVGASPPTVMLTF